MIIMGSVVIVLILLGLFGIANSIFMFIPAFVQGHAVNSTVLRVAEGLLSAAFVVGGIVLLLISISIRIARLIPDHL